MDALTKALKLSAQHAWVVFVVACLIVAAPDEIAGKIGVFTLREQISGVLWALMALSVLVSLRPVVDWLAKFDFRKALHRLKKKPRNEQERERLALLALKLKSLGPDEKVWIKYCLYHNTPSLSAPGSHRTADVLNSKGLVEAGTGHYLALPFLIPEPIWHYLLQHKGEFLDENEMHDARFAETLENFRKSLEPVVRG